MNLQSFALASLLIAGVANAMPPAPGLIERMRDSGTLETTLSIHRDARARGLNAPFDFQPERFRRDGSDETFYNVICILVDFDDNEADVETNSLDHYREMLFSEGEYATGSMRDWFLENSYGTVQVVGEVFGWYRMPEDYGYYVQGRNGFGEFPTNAQGLTRDAVRAADQEADFTRFDNDGDGVVEGLFIVHAGRGAEETGSGDMIWSHAWEVPRDLRADQMRFATYAMMPENGRIGVFGHELGHSLFGLPDLYDTNYQSAGVGFWSMMSGGSWGGGGTRPVHFDVWCKHRLNFLQAFPITEESPDLVIEPIATADDALYVWRDQDWGSEYFLIENRQPIGFDREIPGSGILIWHCDDEAENNAHPWWPDHADDSHNIVALEQADGDYDLERNANGGDAGDPWPGATWNQTFGDDTEPSTRDYEGVPTDVTVMHIETGEDGRMRCDVSLSGAPEPVEPRLFLLERIPDHHRFPHPDDRDTTDEVSLVTGLLREIGVNFAGHGSAIPGDIFDYNIVIYLESWREEDDPAGGLTADEQADLGVFLEIGGKLILVGPDVAANLQSDTTLWRYLHADFQGDGSPRETGNLRTLSGNLASRIAGQSFVYRQRGICDHYVDQVGANEGGLALFTDQGGSPRGVMYAGRGGYRVILQPFLFGGMVDWGGSKAEVMRLYFDYLRFTILDVKGEESFLKPSNPGLTSVWPNPFNHSVSYRWQDLPNGATLEVLDPVGRLVGRLLLNAPSGSGVWSPDGAPAGSYYLRIAGSGFSPKRITLLK